MPHPEPAAAGREVRVGDVLAVLVARLPLIAACTVGLALAAALVTLLRPATYTASVLIVPAVEDNGTRAQIASQIPAGLQGMVGISVGQSPKQKLVESILRSQAIRDEVATRVAQGDSARGARAERTDRAQLRQILGKGMHVDTRNEDGAISVQVDARDAALASRLANDVAEGVNAIAARLGAQVAQRRAGFLERQLTISGEQLTESEQRTLQFANTNRTPEVEEQAKQTVEAAAELQRLVFEAELEVARLSRVAGPDNAQLRAAQAELGQRRDQLRRVASGRDKRTEDIFISLRQAPELRVEARRVLRDYAKNEQVYGSLMGALAQARIDASSNLPVVGLLDAAPPMAPRTPRHLGAVTAIAAVAGLLLGIVLAVLLEVARRMRADPANAALFAAWDSLRGRGGRRPRAA